MKELLEKISTLNLNLESDAIIIVAKYWFWKNIIIAGLGIAFTVLFFSICFLIAMKYLD